MVQKCHDISLSYIPILMSMPLFSGSDVTVEFIATYGGGDQGDIAVDNIYLGECPVWGCMDSLALNYNASANADDSTCYYCSIATYVSPSLPSSVSACDGSIYEKNEE